MGILDLEFFLFFLFGCNWRIYSLVEEKVVIVGEMFVVEFSVCIGILFLCVRSYCGESLGLYFIFWYLFGFVFVFLCRIMFFDLLDFIFGYCSV